MKRQPGTEAVARRFLHSAFCISAKPVGLTYL